MGVRIGKAGIELGQLVWKEERGGSWSERKSGYDREDWKPRGKETRRRRRRRGNWGD